MRCISCNQYFKRNAFNNGLYCQECIDEEDKSIPALLDEDAEVEVLHIVSPSGKTEAKFYD